MNRERFVIWKRIGFSSENIAQFYSDIWQILGQYGKLYLIIPYLFFDEWMLE